MKHIIVIVFLAVSTLAQAFDCSGLIAQARNVKRTTVHQLLDNWGFKAESVSAATNIPIPVLLGHRPPSAADIAAEALFLQKLKAMSREEILNSEFIRVDRPNRMRAQNLVTYRKETGYMGHINIDERIAGLNALNPLIKDPQTLITQILHEGVSVPDIQHLFGLSPDAPHKWIDGRVKVPDYAVIRLEQVYKAIHEHDRYTLEKIGIETNFTRAQRREDEMASTLQDMRDKFPALAPHLTNANSLYDILAPVVREHMTLKGDRALLPNNWRTHSLNASELKMLANYIATFDADSHTKAAERHSFWKEQLNAHPYDSTLNLAENLEIAGRNAIHEFQRTNPPPNGVYHSLDLLDIIAARMESSEIAHATHKTVGEVTRWKSELTSIPEAYNLVFIKLIKAIEAKNKDELIRLTGISPKRAQEILN